MKLSKKECGQKCGQKSSGFFSLLKNPSKIKGFHDAISGANGVSSCSQTTRATNCATPRKNIKQQMILY